MYSNNYPWNVMPYPQTTAAIPAQQQQSTNSNSILWVQGEAGAKSFLIAPGQSVLLMDSESNVFYIKSSDPSGMPMPLRVFDYTERVTKPENSQNADYVTREEFEKRLAELSHAKQPVQSVEQ